MRFKSRKSFARIEKRGASFFWTAAAVALLCNWRPEMQVMILCYGLQNAFRVLKMFENLGIDVRNADVRDLGDHRSKAHAVDCYR
jgi:hypothetical protein